ncbi:copper amine oxidase N-terminal domain-containing protein [Paenibacillus sp. A3M_27_13]|uniref:copper amine oxidase N-terminal domain-containing protein n=1 Tax=Paenibacillus sp. A3M_27_13 TaxID=2962029 RepID=UPI0020B6778D|nr:copper amine oxidase N-terminal domain-containing protein [Paenibacillus sp. A3M_27_13]MCP3746723.1 copper amine oxidase N-terminal domain-containing protein [Paenibacillus sp. A3M_27_13]
MTLFFSVFVLLIFSGSMASAKAKPLQLNVNENLLTDMKSPMVLNDTSFIPVRVIESLGGYKVGWNSKSKTITVIHDGDSLQLTVGNNVALKNHKKISLSTPPVMKDGTTYVPLRFISENFNAIVDWDSKNNGIAIINPDQNAQKLIQSGDLTKARLGVIGLQRVQFYVSKDRPEGESFSFIFPENDFSKMYFIWSDSIYYYELKNGYMSLSWEGKKTFSKLDGTHSSLSKYLGGNIESIWGEQPAVTKRLVFFNDNSGSVGMVGEYGIIDTKGNVVVSHKVQDAKQLADLIVNVQEEKK